MKFEEKETKVFGVYCKECESVISNWTLEYCPVCKSKLDQKNYFEDGLIVNYKGDDIFKIPFEIEPE